MVFNSEQKRNECQKNIKWKQFFACLIDFFVEDFGISEKIYCFWVHFFVNSNFIKKLKSITVKKLHANCF